MKMLQILAVLAFAFAVAGAVTVTVSGKQFACTCQGEQDICAPAPSRPKVPCMGPRCTDGRNFTEGTDGKTFYSVQSKYGGRDWADSVNICKLLGFAGLATLDTDAKYTLVTDLIKSGGWGDGEQNSWWVSYNNRSGNGFEWAPSGTTEFDTSLWMAGSPKGHPCVSIRGTNHYEDAPCTDLAYRVCEAPLCDMETIMASFVYPPTPTMRKCKKPEVNLAAGIYEEVHGPYVFSLQKDEKLTRGDANLRCLADGFDHGLASIGNNSTLQVIQSMLTKSGFKSDTPFEVQFWLYLNWFVEGSETKTKPDFHSYPRGGYEFLEPWWEKSPNAGDKCGTLTSNGTLNGENCEVEHYRLCEATLCK